MSHIRQANNDNKIKSKKITLHPKIAFLFQNYFSYNVLTEQYLKNSAFTFIFNLSQFNEKNKLQAMKFLERAMK